MRNAAEKAIRLHPLLAEAHAALGMAYARDGEWTQSEKSFRRAIELDPNRSASYADFVLDFLMVLGRSEEALKQMRIAQGADPLSNEVHDRMARVLISADRTGNTQTRSAKGLWLSKRPSSTSAGSGISPAKRKR